MSSMPSVHEQHVPVPVPVHEQHGRMTGHTRR